MLQLNLIFIKPLILWIGASFFVFKRPFGFGETFVLWIKELLGSSYLSILVNGSPSGYFSCSRGVRQGDPLSPFLFCLVQEVFSRGISSLVEYGALLRINAP